MPLNYKWADEAPGILICVFESEWTWDEVFSQLKAITEMTEASPEPIIDSIADLSKSRRFPTGNLAQMRRLMTFATPKIGLCIIISENLLIETAVNTFRRVFPPFAKNFNVARTRDLAFMMIAQERERRAVKAKAYAGN